MTVDYDDDEKNGHEEAPKLSSLSDEDQRLVIAYTKMLHPPGYETDEYDYDHTLEAVPGVVDMLKANPEILNPKNAWQKLSDLQKFLIDRAIEGMKSAGVQFKDENGKFAGKDAARLTFLREYPGIEKDLVSASQDPYSPSYIPPLTTLSPEKRYDGRSNSEPGKRL